MQCYVYIHAPVYSQPSCLDHELTKCSCFISELMISWRVFLALLFLVLPPGGRSSTYCLNPATGAEEKWCYYHPNPDGSQGAYLPLSEFGTFYSIPHAHPRCKTCNRCSSYDSKHGLSRPHSRPVQPEPVPIDFDPALDFDFELGDLFTDPSPRNGPLEFPFPT